MDTPQDFSSLQVQIQAALVSTTRIANQIASEDLGFQRSLDSAVGTALDKQAVRLLGISTSLLKSAASISELRTPSLEDVEDVDNNWQGVVDIVDSLLEKADTCLDEYTGVIKHKSPQPSEQPSSKWKKSQALGNSFRNRNLVKPQLSFENKPNNADATPWKPLLKSKPHAKIPFGQSFSIFTNEIGRKQYKHPYETEVLELQYPDIVYHKAAPMPYTPIESTTATFVDTFEGVLVMLAELKTAKEIAVDLEHHDARSYVGLVSLMQISTREKDWIVDTLKPWRENLQVLNEVFANPEIIKVFHGAYMDIVWLQRDLGLYVVGLVDTYHASRVLGYPGASLAYLLKRFVDFDADKKYQLADWRLRPLPTEMFFYARADTHYLLYIYDNLRNELVDRTDPNIPEENRIELVLQKSKETSLLRFERQIYDEQTGQGQGGWYQQLVKTPSLFTNEQFAVFKAVHAWRDLIARKDDDSTAYIMPNHVIVTLAKLMPIDVVSLYGAIHPISYNVKSRAAELISVIALAKEAGKHGPSMVDVLRPDSVGAASKINRSKKSLNDVPISVDQGQLRSDISAFWGSAFGSSIWDISSAHTSRTADLRLAVPMPQLASESLVDFTEGLADRSRLHEDLKSQHSVQDTVPVQSSDNHDDEAFVIRSGQKRKARETEHGLAESGEMTREYDIALNEQDEETAQAKAARKAERKERKRAKKAAKRPSSEANTEFESEEQQEEEEKPFDYSKAESVMHRKAKETDGRGSKGKKPFDPYTKSADAPKGMRKLQTERAGTALRL